MQIIAAEVTILEEDAADVNKGDVPELDAAVTERNDVIVLEESAVAPPAPVLTTSAPAASSECLSKTCANIHACNLSQFA